MKPLLFSLLFLSCTKTHTVEVWRFIYATSNEPGHFCLGPEAERDYRYDTLYDQHGYINVIQYPEVMGMYRFKYTDSLVKTYMK